ncbi:hypothetical protein [Pantoea phage LIMEzero]|uniref:Uncharacterized protein n=1 Tax=Pantoea phage LIMEzero TaxID=943335 RepID=F4N9V9_9CAUD|nr:hypothetical protein LIMEzero_ORF56 [Pantoea phage LIMEzero]CBY88587.1 hypothetical protein [Pantoea phage LIMEzero]
MQKRSGTFTLSNLGHRYIVANVPSGESIDVYLINSDGDEVLIDRFVMSTTGECYLDIPTKFVCSAGAEVDIA